MAVAAVAAGGLHLVKPEVAAAVAVWVMGAQVQEEIREIRGIPEPLYRPKIV
jgi:hypothetical protein